MQQDRLLIREPDAVKEARDLIGPPGRQAEVTLGLLACRAELTTVPGDNPASPPLGVFSTRSPDRPNPIGLHRVQILTVEGLRILVSELEALDGTPVIDIKPVIDPVAER
jgi:tRNA (Thr-GGU) A37 N-methylase